MLLDIPANLELIVADTNGVRTLHRGDNLDMNDPTMKIMGMRMIGASQTAINRVQTQNNHLQFGELIFNVGASLAIFQHFGTTGLMIYGVLWMIATMIAKNTKRELDSLAHLRKSSDPSPARSAENSPPSSTE